MFAEGESSGMRIFATALLAVVLSVGVCGVLFCCAATFETALTGYPSFAGTGYVIHSATEGDELPDGTLVAFEKGTSFDWRAGDFAVFRTVRGMGVGRVSNVGADRLTLRLGEGGVRALRRGVGKSFASLSCGGQSSRLSRAVARSGFRGRDRDRGDRFHLHHHRKTR